MSDKKWQNYVGEICTSRDGKTKYINIIKDFTVYAGQTINLQSHTTQVQSLFEKGIIDEETRDKRLRKEWVSQILSIRPQDKAEGVAEPDNTKWVNDAVEVRETADGGYYIMVKNSFSVKKDGKPIFLKKVTDDFDSMFEKGIVTEEKLQNMLNGIKMKDADGNIVKDNQGNDKNWLHFRGNVGPVQK